MKAAIYCRVSTEDQEREGTSLQSQLEACLGKARELGYEVPDEFRVLETCSGLILDRPRLAQVRQWVRLILVTETLDSSDLGKLIAYTLGESVLRNSFYFCDLLPKGVR